MLKRKLQPAANVNAKEAINAAVNAGQEATEAKVRELGSRALDALYDELDEAGSDESKARIVRLIDVAIGPVNPELRRRLLAIGLAAQLGTAEAQEILRQVAAGPVDAPETQAANSALRRLEQGSQ